MYICPCSRFCAILVTLSPVYIQTFSVHIVYDWTRGASRRGFCRHNRQKVFYKVHCLFLFIPVFVQIWLVSLCNGTVHGNVTDGRSALLTNGKGFVVDDFLTHIVVSLTDSHHFFHLTTPRSGSCSIWCYLIMFMWITSDVILTSNIKFYCYVIFCRIQRFFGGAPPSKTEIQP